MGGTAVPKKLHYRIGEACRAVDIQPYVLRYWETEFEALGPGKSKSGQRVYSEQELGVIRRIKELLYEEGYTIAGAKKRLQSELDEGRSFASPEVEGELFEGGEGAEGAGSDDDVPAVAVGLSMDAETEASDAAPPSVTMPEWARTEPEPSPSSESAFASEPVAEAEAAVAAHALVKETNSVEDPVAKHEAPSARGSKSRGKREVAATRSTATVKKSAVGGARDGASTAASAAANAAPGAVDSALTDRVETLEHGLRRVLAEVRHLRGLLADSDSGR